MYKVLIVDDEEIIRNGLRIVIAWDELQVEEIFLADSGEMALDILKKEEIDFLLTDICMVNMNGLELIEKINKIRPELRIVVLTGYDNFDYARQCCKMQVHDYLLKPIDEELLYSVVKKQLEELAKIKKQGNEEKAKQRAVGVTEQFKIEQRMQELISGKPSKKLADDIDSFVRVVILLPILNLEKGLREEFAYIYLSIKNMCISLFDIEEKGITFEDKYGRITIAIYDNQEESEEQIIQLKKLLKLEWNISLNILVGTRVENFQELYLSYNDALLILPKVEEGKNSIYKNEKTNTRLQLYKDIINELQTLMEENIDDIDFILKTYDTYVKCTNAYSISTSLVRKSTFQLTSLIYYRCLMESKELEDGKLKQLLNGILTVDKAECLKLGRNFLIEIFSTEKEQTHEFIRMAKEYIDYNLSEEITLSTLAEIVFVTPIYFSRLFKQETGEGCNDYIVRKRMEKAKILLETTTIRSGEIAFMVGYKDVNYFSMAFKKNVGTSPKEYREKIRGQNI